jgi:hypothetical protein
MRLGFINTSIIGGGAYWYLITSVKAKKSRKNIDITVTLSLNILILALRANPHMMLIVLRTTQTFTLFWKFLLGNKAFGENSHLAEVLTHYVVKKLQESSVRVGSCSGVIVPL